VPIPVDAIVFRSPIDPADQLDQYAQLLRDDSATTFLDSGEGVASFSLVATAEATAMGLQIKTGTPYDPALVSPTVLKFWTQVAPGMQSSPLFDGAGLQLGIELTITTTNSPPRIKQRTLVFTVRQR